MPAASKRLVLLHTNDIHSHFERMPRISRLLSELRRKHQGEAVLTIDVGDHMDRMRIETEGTDGRANVEVMNQTGYDLAIPGNNEGITFTAQALRDALRGRAQFRYLAANLYDAATGVIPEWLAPYEIRQFPGMTVGLIGVTVYFPDFYRLLGWDIREPFEVVRKLAAELRPKVDVLVVLSHLGYSQDERMAREIAGIDVILGGHTHHLLEQPVRVGDTYLGAAGKFGQYVGEMVIELPLASSEPNRLRVTGCCHPVGLGEEEEDEAIRSLIAERRAEGASRLGALVTTLPEPMPIDWESESPLGNLLAAGLRRRTGAEIGLVNAGQLLQSLREGQVTFEQLHAVCPSPINPCRLVLRGEKLRIALEESLLEEFRRMSIRGFGFRGHMLGCLCTDGLLVEYEPQAPPRHRTIRILVNGAPLEPERLYTVGSIDMFTFGVGYKSLREAESCEYVLPDFIRDILAIELTDADALAHAKARRWFQASADSDQNEGL